MELLNKAPRWFIIIVLCVATFAAWGSLSFIVKNSYAQVQTNTKDIVRIDAVAQDALDTAARLEKDVAQLKASGEVFRVEYRQDQKDLDKKLDEQKTILLKISSKI